MKASVEAAADSLARGNDEAAIGQLSAFINHVEAQRGKKLTDGEADSLIETAEKMIASISSGVTPAPANQRRIGPQGKLSTIWGKLKTK